MERMTQNAHTLVVPAKAGIHFDFDLAEQQMGPGFRRNDGVEGSSRS
jgi:hypothetical protein